MSTMPADYRLDSNETLTLARAVEQSRTQNEIVTLDWDSQSIELAEDELSLSYDTEGSVVNGEFTETWGSDWRVHLRSVDGLADW
jgi:hypothetical protein